MNQPDDISNGITIPPCIPDLEIDISQERSKGKERFGKDFMWDNETQFLENLKMQLEKVENDIERETLKELLVDFNHTFYNVEKTHLFKELIYQGSN